jgi:hypothetical protein
MSQFLVYFSNFHHFFLQFGVWTIVGLAYQGKDIIVFRFIIEYNSLRDFSPLGNRSIFIWEFLKDDILACVETCH